MLAYLVGMYFYTEYYPSHDLVVLYQFLLIALVSWYIVSENREAAYVYHPYELGMLAWLFWPFYIPYYLYKSRRLRGVALFCGLVVLVSLESVVSVFWYFLTGGDA